MQSEISEETVICFNYSSDPIDTIRNFLKNDINVFMNWFQQNYIKANPEKSQSMLIWFHSCNADGLMIPLGNAILSMERMRVLGVTIDDKLNFSEHISKVCIKAGRQLNVLQRLKRVIDFKSRIAVNNLFITIIINFNYCPIVWMFTSKRSVEKNWEYSKTRLAFRSKWLSIKLLWSVEQQWSNWNWDDDIAFIGNWGL